MLILLSLCLAAAFLLPAPQINPATNRKITAQNYCPPCQLGKLPSSRISTDILALRAQNLQQLGGSTDQNHNQKLSLLTASQQSTASIPPPVEWCAHPPLPVPYSSLPTHAFTSQPPPVLRPSSCFNVLSSRDPWLSLSAYATIL
jgi:hypothetical protein